MSNPTRTQIRALRTDSASAGDLGLVDLCDAALDGDRQALAECASVLECAQACDEPPVRVCSYCGQRVTGACCERHPLADVEEL
jgi:hypothetical protein